VEGCSLINQSYQTVSLITLISTTRLAAMAAICSRAFSAVGVGSSGARLGACWRGSCSTPARSADAQGGSEVRVSTDAQTVRLTFLACAC
jgi:hypothetical protein